jgi:hypothetical protein
VLLFFQLITETFLSRRYNIMAVPLASPVQTEKGESYHRRYLPLDIAIACDHDDGTSAGVVARNSPSPRFMMI